MKRFKSLSFMFCCAIFLISCTLGRDESTFTISPQGGTYQAFQGAILDVPPNAVLDEAELTLRSYSRRELNDLAEGNFPIKAAFEALPDGQTFDQPVTITLSGLDLEPGTIPLLRLIDPENGERTLVESTLDYDPEQGTLSFEVEHFTTYAVEAGEQVANTECQQNPCRCGLISIEQSDASNACSQDECQILESEVSVQFNDCPGKPVETSYLKEVSPNCTPKMELKADRSIIPPGGSTGITATTSLSCVPVPDQNTDFFIDDGPGSLDPTNRMTDQGGTAKSTYTASEEEGMATLKVNATGSYYAYQVRANGESFNGPMLTYELSEEVGITVKELKGIFEASFSGCKGLVCVNDYQIRIEFIVGEYQDEDEWLSTGNVIQSGSVSSNTPDMVISYQEIPRSTTIDLFGEFDNQTGEYQCAIVGFGELIRYSLVYPGNPELFPIDSIMTGIGPGFNADTQLLPFTFNVNMTDTIQEGPAYLVVIGARMDDIPESPGISGTYTLIIK